jgi:uncharacterized protein YqhQ
LSDFHYGGQAVIEGVMIRGARNMVVAVREPSGNIVTHTEPLTSIVYTSPLGGLPFARGLVMLWGTLVLGLRGLTFSADVALGEEDVEFEGPVVWGSLLFALAIGVAIFFVLPLLLVGFVDRYISSSLLSNVIEGLIRLGLFLLYVFVIGFVPDIRRVFAYHGAEHKTVNAYEAGAPLEPATVESYSTAHPRCGTAFMLGVMVIAIVVFALLGRPAMWLRLLSRVLLIPVIAGISYEFLKFSAAHRTNPLMKAFLAPSLTLQRMTTREPDTPMLEVAIMALEQALLEDEWTGEESTEGNDTQL